MRHIDEILAELVDGMTPEIYHATLSTRFTWAGSEDLQWTPSTQKLNEQDETLLDINSPNFCGKHEPKRQKCGHKRDIFRS